MIAIREGTHTEATGCASVNRIPSRARRRKVRGRNLAALPAKALHVSVAEIISHQIDDVGARGSGGEQRRPDRKEEGQQADHDQEPSKSLGHIPPQFSHPGSPIPMSAQIALSPPAPFRFPPPQ